MTPFPIERAAAIRARMPAPRVILTRGRALEYAAAGEGPAVLCLHGGMGGFDQGLLLAASAVGDGFCIVAPSRPGYLGTPLATGRGPEQQADACADLLDTLGIGDTAVVAISGGGPSALQFALRHRDRCRGLVMISACSARLEIRLPWQFHLMRLMARFPALAAVLGRQAAKDPGRALVRSLPDPDMRARLLADVEATALYLALQATLADGLDRRIRGTENDTALFRATPGWPLERITVPVLAVHGTADRVVAFSHAEGLAARVPGAELFAIEAGEHVCLFTHRAAIRERVRAFLEAEVQRTGRACVTEAARFSTGPPVCGTGHAQDDQRQDERRRRPGAPSLVQPPEHGTTCRMQDNSGRCRTATCIGGRA